MDAVVLVLLVDMVVLESFCFPFVLFEDRHKTCDYKRFHVSQNVGVEFCQSIRKAFRTAFRIAFR